ncbi:hypothetical protein [Amycolatopsis sp. H20-H5]|uniref:hypothetical protein n=1 Tax=Amycolatopsis sp. H20-H5 TaxID=3046309 RepID=UPI002DB6A232|nr:hypothetical protein [Amycolatopsis sp. H20-H5]MEC3978972.1 hypothetical protein [Amycolatopsis sp. H20-H5]
MTTTDRADLTAISDAATSGVITSRQLREAGVSARRTATLCRPGGTWRRLLPGVVLLDDTAPTRRQLLHAAIAKFGPEAVITGTDTLRAHGVDCLTTREVEILVPSDRRLTSDPGMVAHRTARLQVAKVVDGIPYAPPARAVLDMARSELDPQRIEHLLTLPLYWGACTAAELRTELDEGNQRGSAKVRRALHQLKTDDTYAQGLARKILDLAPFPPPSWDVSVCDLRGKQLGIADAWWDEIGLAWQFRAPGANEGQPSFSHLALLATGIVLVRCTAEQLENSTLEVTRELAAAFGDAGRRARPKVRALRRIDNAAA